MDIWQGEKITYFRKALRDNRLPDGCATCKWEIENKNFAQSFSRVYDTHRVTKSTTEWPKTMWFMLANSCNLECVHCYGEISSSIRKNRDGLKPLERVYGDDFFDQLKDFLPHLEMAVFLGGETFLCSENFRIWEIIIEQKLDTECVIVTNGTLFNKKIQDIVENLSCYISISLDGATKETIESVRQNGKYKNMMENIARFSAIAATKNRKVELSFCIMPNNYHEFPDFLLLADRLNCSASVNTVYHPSEHSLSALDEDRLRDVHQNWMRRDGEMRDSLCSNKGIWLSEMSRLDNWLKRPASLPEPMYLSPIGIRFAKQVKQQSAFGDEDTDVGKMSYDKAKAAIHEWSGQSSIHELSLDAYDTITCLAAEFCGLPAHQVNLRRLSELLMSLREKYGADVEVLSDSYDGRSLDRTVRFTDLENQSTELRWIALQDMNVEKPRYTLLASTR